MNIFYIFIIIVVFLLLLNSINTTSCIPITILLTRTSSISGIYNNFTWTLPYSLSNVNGANLNGALKYFITEAIDWNTGYMHTGNGDCYRKNNVSYIHFYSFTFCNPDNALYWFNQKDGEGNLYKLHEYGHYLSFDEGKCRNMDQQLCDALHGINNEPKLGLWIGYQNVTLDVRNPTPNAYWYSIPGECPMAEWNEKSNECKTKYPSGYCAPSQIPDGEKCIYNYQMLGQVYVDDLIGITKITNNHTGKYYRNINEYCRDGYAEFLRNDTTYEFISGLEFWNEPLNPIKNLWRIEQLKDFYAKDPRNLPLPTTEELYAKNPSCSISSPLCVRDNALACLRDDSMYCKLCHDRNNGCGEYVPKDQQFPLLKGPDIPKKNSERPTKKKISPDENNDKIKNKNNAKRESWNLWIYSLIFILFIT